MTYFPVVFILPTIKKPKTTIYNNCKYYSFKIVEILNLQN